VVPVESEELRFRPLGLPGFYLVFVMEGKRVIEVRFEEPGAPPLALPLLTPPGAAPGDPPLL
jgi:hypothetical protein